MSGEPNALCFGKGAPPTGLPCRVELIPAGLSVGPAGVSDGRPPEMVPFSSLSISAGGFDHDQLVIEWGHDEEKWTLYIKDGELIRAFRRAAPPELTTHLHRAAEEVRGVRLRHRSIWAATAASLVGLALVVWFGTDLMVEWAVARIPIQWEEQAGAVAYRQLLAGQTSMKEGMAVAAIQEMTNRLTASLPDNPYTFTVTVVHSDMVNALALPGGYVVVFTGLMKKAESGEEVAGVLSHELSHVLRRHGVKRLVKQLGLTTIVSIVLGNHQGLTGLAQQVGMELVTLRFSRDQESEADVAGLRLLEQADIAPGGMIRFFERLAQHEEHHVELLSTHPMSTSRAKQLEQAITTEHRRSWKPFSFDWSHVKESLGRDQPAN